MRLELPCTWISGPSCRFSSSTALPTSPCSSCEFFQSTRFSVRDATYLFALLSESAPGSSEYGQCDAKTSYVFLPSSRSNGLPMNSPMRCPICSSQYFTDHPPCVKPPVGSSSGPPGPCITPSSVRNVLTTSLLIVLSCVCC